MDTFIVNTSEAFTVVGSKFARTIDTLTLTRSEYVGMSDGDEVVGASDGGSVVGATDGAGVGLCLVGPGEAVGVALGAGLGTVVSARLGMGVG